MSAEGVASGWLGTWRLQALLSSAHHGFPALAGQIRLMCAKCRCQASSPLVAGTSSEGLGICISDGSIAPGPLWLPCLPWESLPVSFLCQSVGGQARDPAPQVNLATPTPLSDFQTRILFG